MTMLLPRYLDGKSVRFRHLNVSIFRNFQFSFVFFPFYSEDDPAYVPLKYLGP